MTWECTKCVCKPPCRNRQDMARNHGTPAQFKRACRVAVGEISVDEYEDAVENYQRVWDSAPDEWDSPNNTGGKR